MTGARPYEDQGALFGDLDGLFATVELLPITPVADIRLVPTQGGMFTQPAPLDPYASMTAMAADADANDYAEARLDLPAAFTPPVPLAVALLGSPIEPILQEDDEPDHDADSCALCGMHAYGWIEYHEPGCEAGYGLCQQCPDANARPATVEALHHLTNDVAAVERVCTHHAAVHERYETLGHLTCHHCRKSVFRAGNNGASGGPDGVLCATCQRTGHQLPTADAPGALF